MEFTVGFRIIYTATILYRSHVFLTTQYISNIITIILDPMAGQSYLYGLTKLGVLPTSLLSSSFLFYIVYYVFHKMSIYIML